MNVVYRFLQSEVRCYLDTYDVMTIYHLRDLANGNRLRLKCEDVKVYQAPHYRGLAIDDMLNFAKDNEHVAKALPIE